MQSYSINSNLVQKGRMTISCEGKNVHLPKKARILVRYTEARTKKSILDIEYQISQTTHKYTATKM